MKVVLTTVQVPFVRGGAEFLADNLKNAMNEYGHQAEIVSMPFIDSPLYRIEDHIIAARLMDQEWSWGGKADLCVGLKFPAYYMPHPNKVDWVLHQHRAAYDLFDTDFSTIKNNEEGLKVRRQIMNADNAYLPEAKRIYTIAQNVSNRMQKFNHIHSEALYHPCPDMDKFYCDGYEDYILMPSRINITKRQFLALDALKHSHGNFKIYFVGRPDNEFMKEEFDKKVAESGLQDRVKCFDYVSQEEKFELYAKAKAVLFIPYDEDYGYITLEAMAASKPVITAKDSGGPLEFVTENTGVVVDPTPEAIAKAMDSFFDSDIAEKYGIGGKKHLEEMNITWENVVKELTR